VLTGCDVKKSLNLYENKGYLRVFVSKLYENVKYFRMSVSLFHNTCLKTWNSEILYSRSGILFSRTMFIEVC